MTCIHTHVHTTHTHSFMNTSFHSKMEVSGVARTANESCKVTTLPRDISPSTQQCDMIAYTCDIIDDLSSGHIIPYVCLLLAAMVMFVLPGPACE